MELDYQFIRQQVTKCDRSLSSFKVSIPYQQVVRTETAIADAVVNKMKASDNKYIPLNFIKGTLPYGYIDNIYFLEDTSNGSSTTHALNCIGFQPCMSKTSDIIELDLPKHCTTKRLQPNIFRNLENCIKPSKNDFKRNSAYEKTFFLSLLT